MNDNNDKFTEKISRVLDQSLSDLDAATEVKLSRLKYRALDSMAQKKTWGLVWGSVPLLAVLLLIALFSLPQNRQMQVVSPDFTELNILTATESLGFYAEDIEFYEWLSEVLESDEELFDQHTGVPASTESDHSLGTGSKRNTIAQSGNDRISWGLRG